MGIMKDITDGGGEMLEDVGEAGTEICSKLWDYSPDYSNSTSTTGDVARFAGGLAVNAAGLAIGAGGLAVGLCGSALREISSWFDD